MNLNKKNSSKKKIAHQALKEAEERKSNYEISKKKMPKEIGGPSELEPTRYGDWERKGITSDF